MVDTHPLIRACIRESQRASGKSTREGSGRGAAGKVKIAESAKMGHLFRTYPANDVAPGIFV